MSNSIYSYLIHYYNKVQGKDVFIHVIHSIQNTSNSSINRAEEHRIQNK